MDGRGTIELAPNSCRKRLSPVDVWTSFCSGLSYRDNTMNFWLLPLLIATCYCIYVYFKKRLEYFRDLGVPYLPGWPVVGNIGGAVVRTKHVAEIMREIYNVDPDAKYVGAFDFVRPVFVIRDPDLIKSITVKDFDSFSDHRAFIDRSVDPIFGNNLVNLKGTRWREVRNLISSTFTSGRMRAMYDMMSVCAKNFVGHVEGGRHSVPMKDWCTKYASDVIASCAFGINVDSLKDPDNDFFVYGNESTDLNGILSLKFFLGRSFPKLMKMLDWKFVPDQIRKYFEDLVRTTIEERQKKGISKPDIIQVLMESGEKLDITEITAFVFIFFFGGFENASTQMCIIAHELALNPEVQSKLQAEIDGITEPSYEAINALPYLDAVFNESLRRHTQVFVLERLCTKPYELPPVTPGAKAIMLQPGTCIWVASAAMHMDPKYFENPEKFDPDRYYQKKTNIGDLQMSNLGLGIGPRSCIGNRFATLQIKVLFFFLLAKFTLKPNEKTCSPLSYSKKNFTLTAEGGFWLSILPRS